jgi:GPI ethanolamine phosphate transferase 1
MFAHGASDPDRVDTFMYSSEAEDFTAGIPFQNILNPDSTALDTWVFEHVDALFENASSNRALNKALREDKLVFFLHLLGLDTAGHAYRPYSKEYLHNIKVVDEGLKATVKRVNEFYKDDATAWVFTADHGMSDWGSHGDGHPDNTRTPLIVWGAGINKPDKLHPIGHDEFSADWYLDSVKRVDVNQADIAPLMVRLSSSKVNVVLSRRIEFSG